MGDYAKWLAQYLHECEHDNHELNIHDIFQEARNTYACETGKEIIEANPIELVDGKFQVTFSADAFIRWLENELGFMNVWW